MLDEARPDPKVPMPDWPTILAAPVALLIVARSSPFSDQPNRVASGVKVMSATGVSVPGCRSPTRVPAPVVLLTVISQAGFVASLPPRDPVERPGGWIDREAGDGEPDRAQGLSHGAGRGVQEVEVGRVALGAVSAIEPLLGGGEGCKRQQSTA